MQLNSTFKDKSSLQHSLMVMLVVCFCAFGIITHSQSNTVVHKVVEGETFATVAQQYQISPNALADFNNLDYYEGQLISKTLLIPPKQAVEKAKVVAEKSTEELQVQQQSPSAVAPTITPQIVSAPPAAKALNKINEVKDQPTKTIESYSSSKEENTTSKSFRLPPMKQLMPAVIFLSSSIVVLIGAIAFYKSMQR